MNCEWEVKEILRIGYDQEKKAELIMKFANFRKEDIFASLKKGGKNVSEIYKTLVKLNEKRKNDK